MLSDGPPRRGPGICAMRGSCGRKGMFGADLPCPDDGDAEAPSEEFITLLRSTCGPAFTIPDTLCCTQDQVETLHDKLQQAEPLISSCPACRNNFRSFYCHFTCSPDQSTFLDVVSTQTTSSGETAVEEVDYYVSEKFEKGFYEACKDVQFGATNGFAMDLIGGGAKNASSFLKYMGDVKPGLGSPFQITFPQTSPSTSFPSGISPLSIPPLNCSDSALSSRCTCVDCPAICASLPYYPPPRAPNAPACTVGAVSCLTFSILIIYSAAILLGLSVYGWRVSLRARQKRYERVKLLVDPPTSPMGGGAGNPFSHHTMTSTTSQGSDLMNLSGGDGSRNVDITNEGASTHNGVDSSSTHPSASSRFRLGLGASLLDPLSHLQPRQNKLNTHLRGFFYRLGWNCARRPFLVFAIASAVVAGLNVGWKWFEVETDPVRLWVAKGSEAGREKGVFDESFGPFYRAEQVFVMGMPPKNVRNGLEGEGDLVAAKVGLPPPTEVLSYETLDWWLQREQEISELKSYPNNYTLQDVCFSPAGPGTPCVVQSLSAWFGTDLSDWGDDWSEHLLDCAAAPAECLPPFGQPLDPKLLLGGTGGKGDWLAAKSLVVTFVVSDSLDVEVRGRAEEWERTLRGYLVDLEARAGEEVGVKVAFSTGVSLEEELNKSTNTDVKIVVASYLVMFLYISLTLGGGVSSTFFFGEDGLVSGMYDFLLRIPVMLGFKKQQPESNRASSVSIASPSRRRKYMASLLPTLLSVNSKFTLGLFGIVIVLVAVSSSVGLFSFLGVRVTLIIAEVIPFLVLAVGVDNVFILVHELDRQNSLHGPGLNSRSAGGGGTNSFRESLDDEEADSPASFLPTEERVARCLARIGPSILLSSTTEVVAFGLGALVPMPAVRNFALYAAGSVLLGAVLQVTVFVSAMTLDLQRIESFRMDCFPCVRLQPPVGLYDVNPTASGEGVVARMIRKYYAPTLLRKGIKQLVMVLFGGLFVVAIVGMQRITMGLDQRLALPSDSYLADYFNALDAYLDVGPPVYFVAQGVDLTSQTGQQKMCGRFTTCLELSVANSLEAERKRPDSSFIANPPAAWLDDFLHWTDPILDTCCRVRKADPNIFCSPRDSERLCRPCFEDADWDITMKGLPEGPDFMRYLQQWLVSPTDDECPLGGQAAYGSAVKLSADNSSVAASHFRTFHTPLKTQADFINALAAARRVSADIQSRTGVKMFPYSLFYVFFDQYAHIVSMTAEVLFLALLSILVITSLLLGSWRTGSTVTIVCFLAVSSVMGVMGYWGISLNAISLVNLVISLGIAVEFCSHIARAFMGAGQGLPYDHPSGGKERDERAYTALVDVGPSVFSGITMTKLIGISVLALTRSKLLEVYYFRMWLSLILSGALHGLVLLPVALSYFGGPGYSLEEMDSDWMADALKRPDNYEYAPFRDDDEDSVVSD